MKTYKEIKGKKVRALPEISKKMNAIIVGIFLAIPLALFVFTSEKFVPFVIFCGMVFAFGKLFLPGRVLAVLADDRLYFFKDGYRVDLAKLSGFKKTVYSTDGWVSYRAIREMEYKADKGSPFPMLTIYGDDFELRFRCVGRSFADNVAGRVKTAGMCTDGLLYAEPCAEVEREGLWRKMWEYLETCDPSAVVGFPGADVQFEMYAEGEMDTADILFKNNGREIDVSFDKCGVSVIVEREEKRLDYEDAEDVDAVLEWIRTTIAEA